MKEENTFGFKIRLNIPKANDKSYILKNPEILAGGDVPKEMYTIENNIDKIIERKYLLITDKIFVDMVYEDMQQNQEKYDGINIQIISREDIKDALTMFLKIKGEWLWKKNSILKVEKK